LVEFAVNAFLDAFLDRRLQLVGLGFGFLQLSQTLFPLGEFGIALRGVLDDLIALVLAFQRSHSGVGLGGANEIAE